MKQIADFVKRDNETLATPRTFEDINLYEINEHIVAQLRNTDYVFIRIGARYPRL